MQDTAHPARSSSQPDVLGPQADKSQTKFEKLSDLGLFGGDTLTGLEKLRTRLLDLTRNNRLLNFKHTKQSLRFIDKKPDLLYRQILEGDAGLRVRPVPKLDLERLSTEELARYEQLPPSEKVEYAAEKTGINASYDLATSVKTEHPSELSIQTLLFPEDLEATLQPIRNKTRLAVEETGSNFLHLAFGFLEWYEGDDSEEPNIAPLVLLPVEIRQTLNSRTRLYEYVLSYTGEEVVSNHSLIQKLRSDFNLDLRPPNDSESPETYWTACLDAVKTRRRWKILRWVTLGLFQFRKLLMYQDLDPAKWPDSDRLESNPKIREFFEGQRQVDSPVAEDFGIDDLPVQERELLLIEDADCSQHSAIVDVLRGKDLVIQGPPGTGKSQTITNLIGSALYQGKTVLFVSEKLAALEVVKNRLDKADLGHFCLELHSEKTKKQTVFESLDQRIRSRFPQPKDHSVIQTNLRTRWFQLRDLVELLSSTEKSSGKTVHEVLHLASQSRTTLETTISSLLKELEKLVSIQKVSLPPSRHFEILHEVTNLESIASSICRVGTKIAENPWFGVRARASESSPIVIVDTLEELLTSIHRVDDVINSFTAKFGPCAAQDLDAIEKLVSFRSMLTSREDPLPFTLFSGVRDFGETALENLANSLEDLQKIEAELLGIPFLAEVPETSQDQLAHAAGQLRSLMIDGNRTLLQLSEIRNKLDFILGARPDLLDLFKRIETAFSVTLSLSAFDLDLLTKLVSILFTVPTDDLDSFDPARHKPSLIDLVERGIEKVRSLSEEEASLSSEFYLDQVSSIDQLLQDTTILGRSNFFSFLSPKWRDAWQRFALLKKNKIRRVKPRDATQSLERLTSLLVETERFEKDQEYIEKLGPLFKGRRTDFAGCRRLLDWIKKVDDYLPGSLSTTTRRCRETILHMDRKDLSELSAACSVAMADLLTHFSLFVKNEFKETTVYSANNTPIGSIFATLVSLRDSLNRNLDICLELLGGQDVPLSALCRVRSLILNRGDLVKRIDALNPTGLLGEEYLGSGTDVPGLRRKLEIWRRIRSSAPADTLIKFVTGASNMDDLQPILSAIEEIDCGLGAVKAKLFSFCEVAKLDLQKWVRRPRVLSDLRSAIESSLKAAHQLEPWLQLNDARASLSEPGLQTIFALVEEGKAPLNSLPMMIDYFIWVPLAQSLLARHPNLGQPGTTWDTVRGDFQRLDKELQALNRQLLASNLASRIPPPGIAAAKVKDKTELALIQHQIALRRPSGSIRDTMIRAGRAIIALKPCVMMSPMAVSQFLQRGQLKFDLLIIDEASQMRPEDALGAIARSKQCVIVGDSNQLPPTSFFERLGMEEEQADSDAVIHESESILEAAEGLYQPPRRLKWHYRSQHESLIAFSNAEFYQNSLVVFPSPYGDSPEYGVRLRKLDGQFSGGKNEREAKIIVEAALSHLRRRTGTTLGIVAMNREQANLIEELLEKSIKEDPLALRERERLEERHERVFVKNLENVQGDERDVIMISITYGPDGTGVVKKYFGPITVGNGWRRLNVLFTRARRRVEVFSSMTDQDLTLKSEDSKGVKSLRNYLEFARTGRLSAIKPTDRPPGSPFEEQVASALSSRGFECEIQLGVANYFLDIAVRNPKKPGCFLLGIECDGATYHSHKSARDRDRIRTEVLTRMNWRIHRVWSTDWFRNPKHQLEQILWAIEVAQQAADQEPALEYEPFREGLKTEQAENRPRIQINDSEILASGLEMIEVTRAEGASDSEEDPNAASLTAEAEEISADAWFRLARWAKQKNCLTPWQRSLAYSLGRLAAVGQPPSSKQALYAAAILDQAHKLGFDPNGNALR